MLTPPRPRPQLPGLPLPYQSCEYESMKKSLECELQKLNHTFCEKANFQTTCPSTTRSIFLILTAFAYVDADDRPMVLI